MPSVQRGFTATQRCTWRGIQRFSPWGICICDQKAKNYSNRHYGTTVYHAHPQKESHELYTLQLCNADDRSHTWSALFFQKQANTLHQEALIVLPTHTFFLKTGKIRTRQESQRVGDLYALSCSSILSF